VFYNHVTTVTNVKLSNHAVKLQKSRFRNVFLHYLKYNVFLRIMTFILTIIT